MYHVVGKRNGIVLYYITSLAGLVLIHDPTSRNVAMREEHVQPIYFNPQHASTLYNISVDLWMWLTCTPPFRHKSSWSDIWDIVHQTCVYIGHNIVLIYWLVMSIQFVCNPFAVNILVTQYVNVWMTNSHYRMSCNATLPLKQFRELSS